MPCAHSAQSLCEVYGFTQTWRDPTWSQSSAWKHAAKSSEPVIALTFCQASLSWGPRLAKRRRLSSEFDMPSMALMRWGWFSHLGFVSGTLRVDESQGSRSTNPNSVQHVQSQYGMRTEYLQTKRWALAFFKTSLAGISGLSRLIFFCASWTTAQ